MPKRKYNCPLNLFEFRGQLYILVKSDYTLVLLTADFVQNHPVLFVQNQPIFLSARDFFQIPGGHFSTILSGVLIHMQL